MFEQEKTFITSNQRLKKKHQNNQSPDSKEMLTKKANVIISRDKILQEV